MATLEDIERFIGPRIHALSKQGLGLDDMQVVLGKDTFADLRGNAIWLKEAGGLPNKFFGIDYIVDLDTPRLHSVRAKIPRRKAPAHG